LPIHYGIIKSKLSDYIELHHDYPSQCAERLKKGEVDIGLIPVASLPDLKDYYIVSEWCIGAEKTVDTVKLFASSPLEKIDKIYLDYQSRTSVELIKILCRYYWKINPEFIDAKPGYEKEIGGSAAALIIGDRAFHHNGMHNTEIDLAETWRMFTGLPMVFAVWVSTKPIEHKGFLQDFDIAQEHGIANVEEALNYFKKNNNAALKNYLEEKISYPFDVRKKTALSLFLRLIQKK
jgi:chorismate dehydratase